MVYNDAQACINPVNWRTDTVAASFTYKGQELTVRVDTVRYVLVVPEFEAQPSPLWPNGALHLQDLLFYAPFVRKNVLERKH